MSRRELQKTPDGWDFDQADRYTNYYEKMWRDHYKAESDRLKGKARTRVAKRRDAAERSGVEFVLEDEIGVLDFLTDGEQRELLEELR